MEGRTFGTATTSPPGLNLLRLEETLSAAHLRLSGAYIEKLDWQTCVTRYDRPHTFFYLDPPYWQTEGYGVPLEFGQYERMAAALRGLQGRAILTLNDHAAFHDLFAGFDRKRVELPHAVGGPANIVMRGKLIIYSWESAEDPVGLF